MRLRDIIQNQSSLGYGEPSKRSASHVNVVTKKPAVCCHSPGLRIAPDSEVIQQGLNCCFVSKQATRNLSASARGEESHVPVLVEGEPIPLDAIGFN